MTASPHPRGRPAAVLISPDELASLEDTLELLSDADAMAQLRAADAALTAGDFVTGDELVPSTRRGERRQREPIRAPRYRTRRPAATDARLTASSNCRLSGTFDDPL